MTQLSTSAPRGLRARLGQFFYADEVPYGLALVRILLPLVLLLAVVPRWPRARELFSSDGAAAPLWHAYGMPELLPTPTGTLAVALYGALVFFLLAVSAGWMTRFSLLVTVLLYPYFEMFDMIGTLAKYSCICTHVFFLLCLSNCGAVWSVDSWLKQQRRGELGPVAPPRSPVWPRRLLQLLVGVIYLGAAATKFHTPSFFSGDQLVYWMLTEVTAANPLGDYLATYPALIPIMSYTTIIWEVAFIFTAWRGYGRSIMLSIGVLFHVATWGMLGLIVFPLVYLAVYMAWVEEGDVARWSGWSAAGRAWLGRRTAALQAGLARRAAWFGPAQSVAVYGLLLALTAGIGVEVERLRDPFGTQSAAAPPALVPLTDAETARLLRNDQGVRPQDLLFGFDVGSVTVGGIVADRRESFGYGEDAIVQCSLIPPHEDMWVEFNLHDADGRIVRQHGQIMPREYARSSYTYRVQSDLPPGLYYWVLRYQGRDISRRPFEVTPGGIQTASAEQGP